MDSTQLQVDTESLVALPVQLPRPKTPQVSALFPPRLDLKNFGGLSLAETSPNSAEASEAVPATASLFIVNPLLGRGGWTRLFSTHPATEERVRRLLVLRDRAGSPRNAYGAPPRQWIDLRDFRRA